MEGQADDTGQGMKPHAIEDTASVYSYNSTKDVGQFVKELHGRIFNNLNDSYLLPADQTEWARLDKQGSSIAIAFGGLYPCPETVEAILEPVGGQSIHIIDVGCGTGSWAMQMAIKFPRATVLGIDVAPNPIDEATLPPNLSFEIYDVNSGLGHLAGKMDLVHMRCVSGGISDIEKTRKELELCLKPGGLLLVVDGDVSLLGEDRKTIVPFIRLPGDGGSEVTCVSEKGSWLRRIIWEACEACKIAGASLDRADKMNDLGLWDSLLCDPETARSGGVDLPIGPWAKTEDKGETQLLQYVGTLTRQNLATVHRAYHSILLRHGMDQATLDEWSRHVDEELEAEDPKAWLRFRFYMGRRRAADGLAAPPLRALIPAAVGGQSGVNRNTKKGSEKRSGSLRYPAFDIYYTREENMQRMHQRWSTHGAFLLSVVRRRWEELKRESVTAAS